MRHPLRILVGMDIDESYDVVVVGGGVAGLSAALVLGRSRRSVLVIDAGRPRNAPADHLHNYLGREGMRPAELLEVGGNAAAPYAGLITAAADGMTHPAEDDAAALFEPPGWEQRYSGKDQVWSGDPNPQLVAEVARLAPGTALDVGCGEGGDVIWLARRGWRVTGADFSANGLARAARHADEAGVGDRTDWWQVDARTFTADGRSYDLVTTHYLHPPDGGMGEVVRRLADAVAPGGHLLVVGHAPPEAHSRLTASHRTAMFLAEDLLSHLPPEFDPVVVEQRARATMRDGVTVDVDDSTLLARRRSG